MQITRTERGFEWQSQGGSTMIAQKLWGPIHCRYERVRVIRAGRVVDEAIVRNIGTHANYDGFEGFKNISPGRYHNSIGVGMFQIGDELQIEALPPGMSEEDYWKEMTLDEAIPASS